MAHFRIDLAHGNKCFETNQWSFSSPPQNQTSSNTPKSLWEDNNITRQIKAPGLLLSPSSLPAFFLRLLGVPGLCFYSWFFFHLSFIFLSFLEVATEIFLHWTQCLLGYNYDSAELISMRIHCLWLSRWCRFTSFASCLLNCWHIYYSIMLPTEILRATNSRNGKVMLGQS